jgi:quinolinate synthase
MTNAKLIQRIAELKKQKNAVILAHYYTSADVQAVADHLGDSLALSVNYSKRYLMYFLMLFQK